MAKDQKFLKNLKPFPKGVSGNPKGAPKGKRWSTVLREVLEQSAILPAKGKEKATFKLLEEKLGRKLTNRDVVAFGQMVKAQAGSTQAFKAIADREEGRARPEPDPSLEKKEGAVQTLTDEQLDQRIKELMAKIAKEG